MIMQEGQTRVTADPRKGKITVKRGEDDLMHLIWTDREQGAFIYCFLVFFLIRCLFSILMPVPYPCAGRQEDDLIIFPGDATFG